MKFRICTAEKLVCFSEELYWANIKLIFSTVTCVVFYDETMLTRITSVWGWVISGMPRLTKIFVCNVSHDGPGQQCSAAKMCDGEVSHRQVHIFSNDIIENKNTMIEIQTFFKENKKSFPAKCVALMKRAIGKLSVEKL